MSIASHLLSAFASMLLIALATRLALVRIAPRLPAAFGGFMLALGYAVARYTGTSPFDADMSGLIARAVGTLAGLAILYLWWFQRRAATA